MCDYFSPTLTNSLTLAITEAKFMCSMFQKTKIQNICIWSKERFVDCEGANQEDGRPNGASNPYCLLDEVKGF